MARKSGAGGIFLLAVVLGIVAAFLIWNYIHEQDKRSEKNWQPVVVAAVDIRSSTKINRDMLRTERYPKNLIAEGTVTRVEDVVDRMAQNPINAKAPIRNSDLVVPGQAPKLSYKIPEGMRAIAIPADELRAVGTAVQPGDHIDLIATYRDPKTQQDLTKMIMQNVLVLMVNKGETDPNGKTQGAQSSMTLAVKPEETELIAAADKYGSLRVSLRQVDDKRYVATDGVAPRDIAGADQAPVLPQPVEVSQPARQTPVIFSGSAPSRKDSEITIYNGSNEKKVVIDNR